jgi:hypothetical protein
MRKYGAVFLILALLLGPASCAGTAGMDNSPSSDSQTSASAETPETTPSSSETTAEPSAAASGTGVVFARMNGYKLVFSDDMDSFFSAYDNTDRALDALEPLLFSAAWAALDAGEPFLVNAYPTDAGFEWTTVYHLINDYEFDRDSVAWVDGDIVVQEYGMESFFKDAFGSYTIPEITGSTAELISYDGATGLYTLKSANAGGITFILKAITLSPADEDGGGARSAALSFDVVSSDGTVESTLSVEIAASDESTYRYTIKAAEPAVSALPNPVRESSPQEILDTLGVSFAIPDRALDARYFIIDADGGALAQAIFTLDGAEITYRIRPGDKFEDISGVYETWTSTETVEINLLSGEASVNGAGQGICLWYDTAPGLMYSIYMSSGADIGALTAAANELFIPLQGDA